jgi:hypothetical protein
LVIGGLWFSGQLDEFGIATGAEREELEYQRQVQFVKFSSDCSYLCLLRDSKLLNLKILP